VPLLGFRIRKRAAVQKIAFAVLTVLPKVRPLAAK